MYGTVLSAANRYSSVEFPLYTVSVLDFTVSSRMLSSVAPQSHDHFAPSEKTTRTTKPSSILYKKVCTRPTPLPPKSTKGGTYLDWYKTTNSIPHLHCFCSKHHIMTRGSLSNISAVSLARKIVLSASMQSLVLLMSLSVGIRQRRIGGCLARSQFSSNVVELTPKNWKEVVVESP